MNGYRVLKLHKYEKSKAGGFRQNLSPLDLLLSTFQTSNLGQAQDGTDIASIVTNIMKLIKTGGMLAVWNLLLRTQQKMANHHPGHDCGYNGGLDASYDDDTLSSF